MCLPLSVQDAYQLPEPTIVTLCFFGDAFNVAIVLEPHQETEMLRWLSDDLKSGVNTRAFLVRDVEHVMSMQLKQRESSFSPRSTSTIYKLPTKKCSHSLP